MAEQLYINICINYSLSSINNSELHMHTTPSASPIASIVCGKQPGTTRTFDQVKWRCKISIRNTLRKLNKQPQGGCCYRFQCNYTRETNRGEKQIGQVCKYLTQVSLEKKMEIFISLLFAFPPTLFFARVSLMGPKIFLTLYYTHEILSRYIYTNRRNQKAFRY